MKAIARGLAVMLTTMLVTGLMAVNTAAAQDTGALAGGGGARHGHGGV